MKYSKFIWVPMVASLIFLGCEESDDDDGAGGAAAGGAMAGGAMAGGAMAGGAMPGGAMPGGAMPGGAMPGGAMPGGAIPPAADCDTYCTNVMANCAGPDAQYGSEAECTDYCNNASGFSEDGDNSVACRNAAALASDCDTAGPTGNNSCGSWCEVYCALAGNNCGGDNSLYNNDMECLTACADFDDGGTPGDVQFDTVQCRIYHLGAPAAADPGLHCPHGAQESSDFCIGSAGDFPFRQDAPAAYTRVDRMGMPAVSTALISSDGLGDPALGKNAYNDADPVDDATPGQGGLPQFAVEIVLNLTGLHGALDDDIIGAGLTPCTMDDDDADGLPDCVGQAVAAGGPSVVSLVIPDHLSLNPGAPSGFPNGRRLQDPVMDVTLAIILLDMTVHGPGILAGLPLNPTANDLGVEGAFLSEFPYLHPAQQP